MNDFHFEYFILVLELSFRYNETVSQGTQNFYSRSTGEHQLKVSAFLTMDSDCTWENAHNSSTWSSTFPKANTSMTTVQAMEQKW